MPKYTVQDTTSGKKVTFDWNDPNPPTDADMEQVFTAARATPVAPPPASTGPEFNPDMYPLDQGAMQVARPLLEYGGLTAGGLIGGVPGAGLGYGIGKGIADFAEGTVPAAPGAALLSGAKDVATGATMEMGGQVAGKVIGKGLEVGGRLGKQVIGRLTGTGPGAASEAVKGGEAFTDAMRGKTTGEDIVQNAKDALGVIKESRAQSYQAHLQGIQGGKDIDLTPIQIKFGELMKRYGVRYNPDGTLNMTRTALGKSGNKDIEEIAQTIRDWGKQPGDKTAVGLDTLKRQLDDFYSDSSNARGFVTALRNTVKDTIVKQVPEYAEMTKGYAEATKLIKDIEQGLSLRKQGMQGRVIADQTLRRMMTAMRDNFQLRKELLDVLGDQGGKDLSGQVAGYTMSSYLPMGLAGIPPSILGSATALKYLNPKFLPLMAASSPRVMGEFLRFLGKTARANPGGSIAAGKAAAYLTVPPASDGILSGVRR